MDCEGEIRRAIATLNLARDILVGLTTPCDISIMGLLRDRAKACGNRLTEAEMGVVLEFIEGRSPKEIAEKKKLSEITVSNQLRAGCHKLGFKDRRELRGWGTAVSGFMLTRPGKDCPGEENHEL